ncbi:MAG TPA: CHRD domain-containing protein [Myxococcales bacterium]|jgi:hypothetical protein|nr:CHRD domain-containing protein [Myxococcales bacterium]
MKTRMLYGGLLAGALLALALAAYAANGSNAGTESKSQMQADTMTGYQETPGVSSVAFGSFTAEIDDATQTITFELSYCGLEAPVLFAHVHFGNRNIAGGVSAFFCGGGTKPACPQSLPCPQSVTVTGTITAADVIGPANQGIEAGAIAELIKAMRAGETYANVHSTKFPAGEIRAQINDKNQRQPQ